MIEPTACAVHGALMRPPNRRVPGSTAVVIGAGTLGLATIAALRHLRPDVTRSLAVAKHPEQRRLAGELGATVGRGTGRVAASRAAGHRLVDPRQRPAHRRGPDVVFDCVGSAASIADALAVTAPGGTVVLLGMPGHVGVDLTGLWQREIRLAGRLRLRTRASRRRPAQLRPCPCRS